MEPDPALDEVNEPRPAGVETKVKAAGLAGALSTLGLTLVVGIVDATTADQGLRDAIPPALQPVVYGGLATVAAFVAAYRARHTFRR